MKNALSIVTAVLLSGVSVYAQTTAFSYQGQLNDNGVPANGAYDLQFTLYDSATTNGNIIAGSLVPLQSE
jgi:hypothetical protein